MKKVQNLKSEIWNIIDEIDKKKQRIHWFNWGIEFNWIKKLNSSLRN